jgi:hypothetical protein
MTAVNTFHHVSTFAERRALLTRAASVECQRQAALERRDWPTQAAAERELHRLWRRFAQLDDEP